MRNRDYIEVKGKGKMNTYFLIGNSRCRPKEPDDEFRHLPVLVKDTSIIRTNGVNGDNEHVLEKDFIDNDMGKHLAKGKSVNGSNTCLIL